MRLPDDSQRIVIAGHTGSGKTMEALFHLSQRSIDQRVWIVLDQKGDDLAAKIPVMAPLMIDDPLPDLPGLYVVRAPIEDDGKAGPVSDLFRRIYERGGIGTVVDEGQMLGQRNRGLRTLLTMGRSRGCPLVICTQRPVNIDTYALSESEFLQFFYLPHPDDRDRVARFVPPDRLNFSDLQRAGPFHSFYYDVRADSLEILGPCPEFARIYERMLIRLPKVALPPTWMPPSRVRV